MMPPYDGGGRMGGASLAAELGGIEARLAALPERVNGDAVLLRRGRYLNTMCQLDFGDAAVLLRIVDGRVADLQRDPSVMPSADFAIIGEPAIWRRFLAADPPPGDHDLFAFLKRRELRIVGDLHPLMSHLLYFKAVFACLRDAPR
jgi:hypothetical protein